MTKPKSNIETLLMKEALTQMTAQASLYEAWQNGHWKRLPEPEHLFHSLVSYTHAYERYKLGYKKNPPF